MIIKTDTVVSFHYDLREKSATDIIESTRDGEPVLYLHGSRAVMLAIEEALEGRSAGDHVELEVPPERGYGNRSEDRVMRVPIKHIDGGKKNKFRVNQRVQINTPNGPIAAIVVKPGRFNLDVDANHPLAGKTLIFTIDVESVREASEEELAHGHAHGPGGHQH